jgi:septal ring factor EnvC (AmiA/AmiB activator)
MPLDPSVAGVLLGTGGALSLIAKSLFDWLSASRAAGVNASIAQNQQISLLFSHVVQVQNELVRQRAETDLRNATIDNLQEQIYQLQQKLIASESEQQKLQVQVSQLMHERDELRARLGPVL